MVCVQEQKPELGHGQWVSLPGWQGAWPWQFVPGPAGVAHGPSPTTPLHLVQALSVRWAIPLMVLAPECAAIASLA